jgi:mannose-6-phosphate isomerase
MPVLRGEQIVPGLAVYRTASPEFELSRLDLISGGEVRVNHVGPQVMICVRGSVSLTTERGDELKLTQGQSVWLAASDPAVLVRPIGEAPAQLFRATAGTDSTLTL